MASEVMHADRDSWLQEGCRLQSQGRWPEALTCFEEAVRIAPRDLETLVQLGFVRIQMKDWQRAAETWERVVTLLPKDHRVWCNLSYLYEHAGNMTLAEERARKAIRLSADCVEAWNNLGMALRGQHRFAEAIQAFRQAVNRQPDFALAEFNLATTYLLLGNGEQGWAGYESRQRLPEARERKSLAPRWMGEPLPGGMLLVYADQGLGDTLQFLRFLPEVRQRSQSQIVVSCPTELHALVAGVTGADTIVPPDREPADATAEIAIASIPGVLQANLRYIPGDVPYLHPPAGELRGPIIERLRDVTPGTRRIGLVWQGNPAQGHDYVRSLALRRMLPWAGLPGVTWISLQVNSVGRDQLSGVSAEWPLIDIGERLTDFRETATVLQHLDLVITVDTSMAHLAGALGRPVWTLLGHTPDWRWGVTGDRCPWYPTMRLFRQVRAGDWEHPVRQVQQALLETST